MMNWKVVWTEIMKKGKKLEPGITNKLTSDEIETIMATAAFFEPHSDFLAQMYYDLTVAKYRIFDWVAMLIFGRHKGYGEDESQLKSQQYITRIFADAYLKCKNVKDFIQILRTVDYQVVEPIEIEWA